MLKTSAYNREMVRKMCDMHVTPIILCIGSDEAMKRHAEERKMADEMFTSIMADEEKIKDAVKSYQEYLEKRFRPEGNNV